MKRILFFVLIICVVAFGACKKKSSSAPAQMTAVIDNRAWVSGNSAVTFDKSSGLHLTITADSARTHMRLDIGNYTGVGTYVISDSGNTASYISTDGETHVATSGQILITANTSNGTNQNGIKGTFKFLAGTVQVTSGAFDVSMYLN